MSYIREKEYLRKENMISVVTMSANTAAYAAEAIKPKQRVSSDAQIEDAITLLSSEKKAAVEASRGVVAALQRPTSLSLMLMNANSHLPQGTAQQAINTYIENSAEVVPIEGQTDDEPSGGGEEPPWDDAPDQETGSQSET